MNGGSTVGRSANVSELPALLPWPRSVERREGRFIPPATASLSVRGCDPGDRVLERYRTWTGVPASDTERATFLVQITELRTDATPEFPDESYRLDIGSEQVVVTAHSPWGALRALETLRQIELPAPCLRIDDSPRFGWRGLLLDSVRHFVPVAQILAVLERMAPFKLNRLHWHLTDDQGWRLEVPSRPALTEIAAWRRSDEGVVGGYYTSDDVRAVVEHAARLGIDVVPEIECPGHCIAALAAYPELSCRGLPLEVETRWGIFDDVFCAGSDETFQFLEEVWSHALDLFPSRFVHLGGDEVSKRRWRDCAACQARITAERIRGEDQLQSWFVRRVGAFLRSHGRRFIGWDEILEGGLPEGAVVQSWRGFDGAQRALENGADVVLSPTEHCYLDYGVDRIDLERTYAFDPGSNDLGGRAVGGARVLGGQGNLWTERAPPEWIERRLFPRLCALAERLWSGPDIPFERFLPRLRVQGRRLRAAGVDIGPEAP